MWEPWIDGFERAMRLRRGVWRQIAQSGDREASSSINMIVALSDSCYVRSDLTEEAEEKLGRLEGVGRATWYRRRGRETKANTDKGGLGAAHMAT